MIVEQVLSAPASLDAALSVFATNIVVNGQALSNLQDLPFEPTGAVSLEFRGRLDSNRECDVRIVAGRAKLVLLGEPHSELMEEFQGRTERWI